MAAADSGSLERYLETFSHTVAVMQTEASLRRVASECAQDLAADGVVYAEVRFAPEQHLTAGLTLPQVVEAVLAGFAEGSALAAAAGPADPDRHPAHRDAARGALDGDRRAGDRLPRRGRGRVRHRGRRGRVPARPGTWTPSSTCSGRTTTSPSTPGEAFGLPSIWQAIQWCGADRLGHGVRIVDDIGPDGQLGRLAAYVRDKRIPLELCPSSNVQTGAAASIARHPIKLLRDLRFRVTVNTDNRLMSGTSMSREMALLVEAFGWGWAELQWFTINAMKSAFIPFDERLAIINDVIKPAYAEAAVSSQSDAGAQMPRAVMGGNRASHLAAQDLRRSSKPEPIPRRIRTLGGLRCSAQVADEPAGEGDRPVGAAAARASASTPACRQRSTISAAKIPSAMNIGDPSSSERPFGRSSSY